MRRIALAAVLTSMPQVARAERWLDLALPDLAVLEPALPLAWDGYRDLRPQRHVIVDVSAGVARGAGAPVVGAGALGGGHATDATIVAGRSDLVWGMRGGAGATGIERLAGRHAALGELRLGRYGEAGTLALEGVLEHGRARALAPVARGPGRRIDGELDARALVHLGAGDFATTLAIDGGLGATRWQDAPGLDRAERRALGLALGKAPTDGELPRGVIQLVRGRVEHATIHRALAAAGTVLGPGAVRTIEIGAGVDDLTFHVDREILAVLSTDLGWTWLEADTAAGTLRDDLFRLRLAGAMKWLHRTGGTRQLGLVIARAPGHAADGQRLVSDWRLALAAGADTARYAIRASGGISWLRSLEGGQGGSPQLPRYGSELEASVAIGGGLELGAYHAVWFEPPVAGDPWASTRRLTSEAGLVLRWRNRGSRHELGRKERPQS